jgi:hypothetical protein
MASRIDSMKSAVCFAAVLALQTVLCSGPLYGQVVGGTITGRVTDVSGAAIPNAKVSLKNIATAVGTTITTNSQGIFSAPNLLPGDYEARVSAPGFQTAIQNGIKVDVGSQQALNFAMKVGTINETVEVTAVSSDLQLTSSTISGVEDS